MSKFIPVDPELWAEMVKAASETEFWQKACKSAELRCANQADTIGQMRREAMAIMDENERLKAMPHDDDTCPHLVRANLLEAENARLKANIDAKMFVGLPYATYDEMNAENARLKAEVERLTAFTTRTIIPNEELQAQVERLTKENALATSRYLIASQDIKTLREQVASLCLERIAQKPKDDFTAFMVKLKDEHMNVNELNAAKEDKGQP
jgi:hypothetical protein